MDLKGKALPMKSASVPLILLKSDPPLLLEKSRLEFIKPGNLADDFDQIKDADWIIEAVVERIDKHQLYAQIIRFEFLFHSLFKYSTIYSQF